MLIQGIGDEVISVIVAVVIIGLISLVWVSTHVQDRPLVRAVVIRSTNNPDRVLNPDGLHQIIPPAPNPPDPAELLSAIETTVEAHHELQAENNSNANDILSEVANNEPVIDNNIEADEDGTLATIKVRFMNETSLEIQERLSEQLGRFISKHLDRHLNLTADDRVKLIYNGRVLGRNQSTLEELGLTDNCVIHCLVQRSVVNENNSNNTNENQAGVIEDLMDFDVSHVCLPLLGLVLVIIWWCQMIYSQYFNLTSTISLVSLTVLFLASVANTYFIRA